MSEQSPHAARLAQQAISALNQGNAVAARDLFQQATVSKDVDASAWLGLAFANARLGEYQATLDAVDRALELEPHNLRALLFKGDHLAQYQQTRKALVFYKAALKLASRLDKIPPDIETGLKRAQASCQRFAADYEDYLLAVLEKQGYRPGSGNPRFQQALDIAFGKQEIFYQQPTRFYYPGLPQIQFYERSAFPWLEELEAAIDKLRSELLAVMQDLGNFSPYLQSGPDAVNFNDTSNLDSADWGAFYFYQEGLLVEENAARCPATIAALNIAPLPRVPGNTPHALYSRLAGKTKIPPHTGLLNTRLICHLPLLVPPNCGGLRVGSQVQQFTEGEAYVFDDSFEHEAWNNSDRDRVVLLFDIWRPELDDEERELIGAMLQAVQGYENEV